MCSLLSMWPKSNHIAVFALDLKSACEGEHMIFGRTYDFWSSEPGYPRSEWSSPVPSIYLQMIRFILLHGWVKFHCVSIPHFLNSFVSTGASWLFP
jgi:hypothetical protein